MKLLIVSHYFASHGGGIEIVAGRLAEQFASAGWDVAWLATAASQPPAWDDPRLRAVPLGASNAAERWIGIPYPVPSPRALRRIIQEVARADVVMVHDGLYLTSVVAAVAARRSAKPLLVVQHIGLVPYGNPILRGLMQIGNRLVAEPILSAAERVVFISQTTASHFAHVRYRASPAVIFNGLDTSVFTAPSSRDDVVAARRRMGLPEDRSVVLFVGRFVEKKGLGVLERMVRARPEYHFAFAGWGPMDPDAWNCRNVQVFPRLDHASLAELYRASDVFVLPSVGEGYPLVVQEALACGLPVVCSQEVAGADPGAADLLTPVPLNSREPEAAATRFLVAVDRHARCDSSMRVRLARSMHAAQRYCWSKTTIRYCEILNGLIGSPEPRLPRPHTASARETLAAANAPMDP